MLASIRSKENYLPQTAYAFIKAWSEDAVDVAEDASIPFRGISSLTTFEELLAQEGYHSLKAVAARDLENHPFELRCGSDRLEPDRHFTSQPILLRTW